LSFFNLKKKLLDFIVKVMAGCPHYELRTEHMIYYVSL